MVYILNNNWLRIFNAIIWNTELSLLKLSESTGASTVKSRGFNMPRPFLVRRDAGLAVRLPTLRQQYLRHSPSPRPFSTVERKTAFSVWWKKNSPETILPAPSSFLKRTFQVTDGAATIPPAHFFAASSVLRQDEIG